MSDLQEIFPGFMKLPHAFVRTDGQCEYNRRGEMCVEVSLQIKLMFCIKVKTI